MPWCIRYEGKDETCAVLGGEDPGDGMAQRVCDQQLVTPAGVVFRMEPTCPNCLRVWKLIEEFGETGTPVEVEETEF